MSVDLVAFLRARLDDDERRARRGYYSDAHWDLFTPSAHLWAWQAWRERFPRKQWDAKANDVIADASRDAIRERITAHEEERSTRMLAEVDAKRQLIERLAPIADGDFIDAGEQVVAQDALRFLALPYADHPDYHGDWRP